MSKANDRLNQYMQRYEQQGDPKIARRLLAQYQESLLPKIKEAATIGDSSILGGGFEDLDANDLVELYNSMRKWVSDEYNKYGMTGMGGEGLVSMEPEPEAIGPSDLPPGPTAPEPAAAEPEPSAMPEPPTPEPGVKWPDIDLSGGRHKLDPDDKEKADKILSHIIASNQVEYSNLVKEFMGYPSASAVGPDHKEVARWFAKKLDQKYPGLPDAAKDILAKAIANRAEDLRRERMKKYGEQDPKTSKFPFGVEQLVERGKELEEVRKEFNAGMPMDDAVNKALRIGFKIDKDLGAVEQERRESYDAVARQYERDKGVINAKLSRMFTSGPSGTQTIRPGVDPALAKSALRELSAIERKYSSLMKKVQESLSEIKRYTSPTGAVKQQFAELAALPNNLRAELRSSAARTHGAGETINPINDPIVRAGGARTPSAEDPKWLAKGEFPQSDPHTGEIPELTTEVGSLEEAIRNKYNEVFENKINRIIQFITSIQMAAAGERVFKTTAERRREADMRAKQIAPKPQMPFRPFEEEEELPPGVPGLRPESIQRDNKVRIEGLTGNEYYLNGLTGTAKKIIGDKIVVELAKNTVIEDKAIVLKKGEFVVECCGCPIHGDDEHEQEPEHDHNEFDLHMDDEPSVGQDSDDPWVDQHEPEEAVAGLGPLDNKDYSYEDLAHDMDDSEPYHDEPMNDESNEVEQLKDRVESLEDIVNQITSDTGDMHEDEGEFPFLESAACSACKRVPCLCCEACNNVNCICEQRVNGLIGVIADVTD